MTKTKLILLILLGTDDLNVQGAHNAGHDKDTKDTGRDTSYRTEHKPI